MDNIEKMKTRTINRCNFVKEVEHIDDSICYVYLIIMSDATGGRKFALLGAVAYVIYHYKSGKFRWQIVIAKCKIANYNQTVVQRELKALCLGIQIGKNASEILKIRNENVHYYVDNAIILDQLNLCSSKGPTSINKGNALACMEVLKETSIENVHFIPSELNFQ